MRFVDKSTAGEKPTASHSHEPALVFALATLEPRQARYNVEQPLAGEPVKHGIGVVQDVFFQTRSDEWLLKTSAF